MGNEKTPQGRRMLLGAFRGRNPLERIVGVPSLWPRHSGVLQQHGLGVIPPSGVFPNRVIRQNREVTALRGLTLRITCRR